MRKPFYRCVGVCLALGGLIGMAYGCTAAGTNPSFSYVPPAICVQDNATGKYDSEILAVLPNPTGTGVALQLADYGAIAKHVYSDETALMVITDIRGALSAAKSYGELATYVAAKLDDANLSAGIVIFTNTGMLAQFNSAKPIGDCDRAIISRHLDNQESLVKALAASGK
jgi:hypothetical protein